MDQSIKEQLGVHFKRLSKNVILTLSLPQHGEGEVSQELKEMVVEVASLSNKLSVAYAALSHTPSVGIGSEESVNVVFAGMPGGHEFTSFVLAILQQGGIVNDALDVKRAQSINEDLSFVTYFSESCQNCPEVVQALNFLSIVNPRIRHVAVNGASFQDEVKEKNILSVPTVLLNNEVFSQGRQSLNDILEKFAPQTIEKEVDLAIIGAGPSGISASLYASRKGFDVALIGTRFGGQVLDTLGIENYPAFEYIEGPQLAQQLLSHTKKHDNIHLVESEVVRFEKQDDQSFIINLKNGTVKARALILATGANWRNVGVKGEQELKNKGVAYCSHCDGPLFKGKDVAVIGGGNSGIEGALDLAKLVNKVYVLEYMPSLKADKTLLDKVKQVSNIEVITSAKTLEILGKNQVEGLHYLDMSSNEEKTLNVSGVFVQIGLSPNTSFLEESGIVLNSKREIVINDKGQTSIEGVFASGDASSTPFKQIVVAAGSGSTASLAACEYLS